MRKMLSPFVAVIAFITLAGCTKQEDASASKGNVSQSSGVVSEQNASATDTNRQVFQVRGVVKEIKDSNTVEIAHEEIPNYMVAMTMDFDVKNTNELANIAPNDEVAFTMIVTEDDGWIENIRKTGVDTSSLGKTARPKTRIAREVEELNVGDKMADYTLTNTLGEKFTLSGLNGKAYVFTFIFTRCPFPTFCPRMNQNFAAAYEALNSRQGSPTNWQMISISFDPDFDTPARLAEYSSGYKADPTKWVWATGDMAEIDALTEQVGLVFAFENNTFNHNLRTVVVDKNGRIRKIFVGNEWRPEELVEEMVAAAEGQEIKKDDDEKPAQAPLTPAEQKAS